MDGAGFHVDLTELDETAAGITASVGDQTRHRRDELPGISGDGELREAFDEFRDRWSEGLDLLTADAATIAEALRLAATAGAR